MAVYVIAFPSSYFFLFICYKGGGVSGNAWRRHPSHLLLYGKPGQRVRGTGKRGGDVHGQNVPLGTSVDTPSELTLASSWRWLAALKAEWNGRRKHLRDFLPWSHWSSIRSRRNARGSCPTGSEVPARPSTGIAGWEPSTTAPRDALYSLREDDRQSGADEERGPDVKTFSSCTSFHEDRWLGAEHDGAKGRPVLLEGRRQTVWGRRRERPGR